MHGNLLLTGATGALGPQLAAELLTAGAARRIGVLMRPSTTSSTERFSGWVQTVASLLPPSQRDAIGAFYPVFGDVCRPSLGLDRIESRSLLKDIDVIIHAAADTRFIAPQAEQREVNVSGTEHMLDWARSCPCLRQFILVSSTYVAGSRTGQIHEDTVDEAPPFVTYYQRTKWEAERLATGSGLPVGIARISLIMGSHANGFVHRSGAVHNLIRWFGRGLVPMLPGMPGSTVDLIATETAARCIVRAVTSGSNLSSSGGTPIWHVAAGREAVPLRELIDFVFEQFLAVPGWLRRRIPKARIVSQEAFNQLRRDAVANESLAHVMEAASSFLPDLLFPKVYDTAHAELLWGGRLPLPDWRETLGRVIRSSCVRGR